MQSQGPQPCIITVAITGSVPRKENNPAVPITVSEQIESTHAAFEAGAALVHVHVRNDDQSVTSNPDKFADFQERIRKVCPGIIVQFSTGGRGRALQERGAMLWLRPDMASLATGSVNFPTSIYENPPDFVEALAREIAAQRMRLAARDDDEIAGARGHGRLAGQGDLAAPFRNQVVDHDVLRLGHVLAAHLHAGGLADAPGLGEPGVEEHRAGEPHDSQHVG